jgi:creatinine amidohydrolase
LPKLRYEEMLPHEIVEARTKCPIAYVAIGGVEWHGQHLCVGNDTVKANALALKCADKGGGLVFPPLFWGENRESHLMEANHNREGKISELMGLPSSAFAPGYMQRSIYHQDRAYIELLVHILRQIESLGFKVIVILAGHYPLLKHARAAVEWYSLDGKAKAWACTGYELVRDEIPEAGDHAAAWETSLLMALRPDCVDMSQLPDEPEVKLVGVGGRDPREHASLEFGQRGVELIVERITARARELLGEG